MATVYAVYDGYGLVGRCDARCHEATKPQCECICGGAHHGVGAKITQEEVNAVTDEELVENAEKVWGIRPLRVFRLSRQLGLFEGHSS